MRSLREYLRSWIRPRRVDDEIRKEIQFHLDMEADKRMKAGVPQPDAEQAARRAFGGMVQAREEVRDARGMTFFDMLRQDVRFGARTLRREPGYTLAVIAILALGIGANTAMFSVLNGVLFKPLPFSRPGELVLIQQGARNQTVVSGNVSIPELYGYRARLASVKDLVEHHGMSFTLLNQGEPDRVDTGVVSSNFFDMLGVHALYGRTFLPHEDDLGAEGVLVLSHRYWKERFGGDPSVVGRVFQMNNRPHTVVGVLPDFPEYPRHNDVYMPTSACPSRSGAEQALPAGGFRSFAALTVLGRLAPGMTAEKASAEIATVAQAFEADHKDDYVQAGSEGLIAQPAPLQDTLTTNVRAIAWMLSGATLLVLMIACANVANLALARTSQRGRELAVRAALGAGRGRLIRQLLTESLLLAVIGGVGGLFLAWVSLDMLTDFVARFTTRTGQIRIDGAVLTYSLVAALLSGLVFGIVPALATRKSLQASMRLGSGQTGDSPARQRLRGALVVAQVTVSSILLVGAGLLIESAYRLAAEPLGYDGDRVLTAAIFGNFSRATTVADGTALTNRILEKLRSTPGAEAAAATDAVPQSNIRPGRTPFEIEGRAAPAGVIRVADQNRASDGYFTALKVKMLAGRDISSTDVLDSPRVAIINQSMARYWDGANPIDTRIRIPGPGGNPVSVTVVGVVPDIRIYSADREREVPAQFYLPVAQNGGFVGRLMVRTTGDPMTMVPALKAAVHGSDPQIPVEEIQTLADLRNERQASPRLTTALLGIFAAVALVITLVGIAGVIATSVSQRTREFGLRLALGASPRSVLALVVRQGLVMVAAGLVLGLAGAIAFSEVLASYLYNTPPTDPSAYIGVAVLFIAAGIAACAAPAKRATTIDPLTSLKAE
jgi:putative ABC transport system permease protein